MVSEYQYTTKTVFGQYLTYQTYLYSLIGAFFIFYIVNFEILPIYGLKKGIGRTHVTSLTPTSYNKI